MPYIYAHPMACHCILYLINNALSCSFNSKCLLHFNDMVTGCFTSNNAFSAHDSLEASPEMKNRTCEYLVKKQLEKYSETCTVFVVPQYPPLLSSHRLPEFLSDPNSKEAVLFERDHFMLSLLQFESKSLCLC